MQTVLERLIVLAGLRVEVRQKANLLRATDTAVVRANTDKLRRETGWSPRFSLDRTLTDVLNAWREQSEKGTAHEDKVP
jgi:GDP-4-dehydro-6-deoxy-D-mannose reductase